MQFSKALLVAATFLVATVAQTQIAFTQIPAAVIAGTPTVLKWSGGDDSSFVTITLKQGNPSNLTTISIITGDATGNSFSWTPSASLPNANDYALMISQGLENINYSGEFPLTGGSTASPSTTAAPSTSTSPSPSASISAVLSSLNGTLSSLIASNSLILTTGVTVTASASGSGIPMSRNTTFVSQTLTAASSSTTAVVVTETTSTAAGSTTAGGASSSPSASKTAGAAGLGSPLAFVLSAVAAIVYLN